MVELLGVALVLTVVVVLPVFIVTAGILIASLARQWFRLQRARLAVEKDALAHRLAARERRRGLPAWLDPDDPVEVAAWRAALKETWIEAARQRTSPAALGALPVAEPEPGVN